MKRKTIYAAMCFAIAASVLFNCSRNNKDESTSETSEDTTKVVSDSATTFTPQFQVDTQFQQQLASVFQAYVSLKDAFVASDVAKVKVEAVGTAQALSKVDMKLVSGAAHNDWMNFSMPIQNSLREIETASDLEAQRKSFSTLSDNLYKSIKAFGLGGKDAFYEYCPMAFNNQGGYWLSDQSQIRNPYFGEKMPTCGEVKEKLN